MLGITVVNYGCGRIIGLPGIGPRLRFWVAACAIAASLGTLGFFKYFLFLGAKRETGAPYADAPGSEVLILGDSFLRI
jgi:hypothetical protein